MIAVLDSQRRRSGAALRALGAWGALLVATTELVVSGCGGRSDSKRVSLLVRSVSEQKPAVVIGAYTRCVLVTFELHNGSGSHLELNRIALELRERGAVALLSGLACPSEIVFSVLEPGSAVASVAGFAVRAGDHPKALEATLRDEGGKTVSLAAPVRVGNR